MSTSRSAIFGLDSKAELALPGTYGKPAQGYRLPEETHVGPVSLLVSDLDQSVAYYQNVLGLELDSSSVSEAVLMDKARKRTLVRLVTKAGVRRARRGRLGLFHFAILLPDRASLGAFVRHLGEKDVYAGAGDHLVSEAFYLHDPDGHGIEVYADRPRSEWRRNGRELMMATETVDVAGLLREAETSEWKGMPEGTIMGHVHLHVGDTQRAEDFFSGALGLDAMVWSYPGALFLSAGGYHHHVGANTWAGPNATAPDEEEARLLEWSLELPKESDLGALEASLRSRGAPYEVIGDHEALTADPWGTAIRVRVGMD